MHKKVLDLKMLVGKVNEARYAEHRKEEFVKNIQLSIGLLVSMEDALMACQGDEAVAEVLRTHKQSFDNAKDEIEFIEARIKPKIEKVDKKAKASSEKA